MFIMKVAILVAVASLATADHYPPGYSYAKFSGPVSGPEKEIHVADKHGHGHKVDYVAKPDYKFEYGVEDPKSKVSQSRKESRHGDEVTGEYSVLHSDGVLRTVKYTADKKNGFQAQLIESGKAHEQPSHPAPVAESPKYHYESAAPASYNAPTSHHYEAPKHSYESPSSYESSYSHDSGSDSHSEEGSDEY